MKFALASITSCVVLAATSRAQEPVTTGAVHWLAAPPAAVHRDTLALESPTQIFLFRERGAYVLPAAVRLDFAATGVVTDENQLSQTVGSSPSVPSGTQVESYFLHQDSPGNPGSAPEQTLGGTITFPRPILGVACRFSGVFNTLQLSDLSLGNPQTSYPGQSGDGHNNPHRGRGLELGDDQFEIYPDRLKIRVSFKTKDYLDQLRVIIAAEAPAQAFCFGDLSSGQSCPCQGNNVAPGVQTGCKNSTGAGGLLEYASGVNSVSGGAGFSLRMRNLTPNTFGLLYMGQSATQDLFADGFRCVNPGPPGSPPGLGFLRFPMQNASAQGEIVQSNIVGYMNGGAAPVIQPGATWHFQGYYRNPAMHCTNANLTNGLSVTFY